MAIDETEFKAKYELMAPFLNEKLLRLWAGNEAKALGYGGVSAVMRCTGLTAPTIRRGMAELEHGASDQRVRAKGGGRKPLVSKDASLLRDLEALVDPLSRGDPDSPLRWTTKSCAHLALALNAHGPRVSSRKINDLLHDLGYSLQAPAKTTEGLQHPDRDAQFEHINAQATAFLEAKDPVVSVDCKKKELVGDFKNGGREWQPKGDPEKVLVHDFPSDALGKAIPYGVYDVGRNEAWVSVGTDHDTPKFAVQTLENWWWTMGKPAYPDAKRLMITADSGGSNARRCRGWKAELQQLSNKTGLEIHVSHFPPGTSKWNKIEHRLFSQITLNWRGRKLVNYETVVSLIASTRTETGLRVRARIDRRPYPTGVKVPDETMRNLNLEPAEFHGEWNYVIKPQPVG